MHVIIDLRVHYYMGGSQLPYEDERSAKSESPRRVKT